MAKSCAGKIHVLYVIDTGVKSQYNAVNDLMSRTESSRKHEEIGEKAINSLSEKLELENVKFENSIVKGNPED